MNAVGPEGALPDAHREHLVALLREHFAAGRFEVDEFGRRVETLLGATSADEAAAAVEDLPPLTGPAPEPRRRWWRRMMGGRHAQSDAAQAGWLPTRERFRDPSSGRLMRVWVDPADAGRHYVPDEDDSAV